MRPPAGYHRVHGPRAWGFALPEAKAWTEGLLGEGRSLRAAAAEHPEALEMRGRGTVRAIPAQGGRWVVRPYLRGGWVAGPLLRDRYLRVGVPRPLAEVRASAEARERGVPTPRVVAGAVYPGRLFYRADLVTEYVPDATELAEVLFGATPTDLEGRIEALGESVRLVARLARAGVEHADLNARNILLKREGSGSRALLLDLDRCRIRKDGSPMAPGPMLRRLERSLDKLGTAAGRPLRAEERAVLRGASSRLG